MATDLITDRPSGGRQPSWKPKTSTRPPWTKIYSRSRTLGFAATMLGLTTARLGRPAWMQTPPF